MKTNDVLTHFGGKRATAEALGLSTQAVQAWKTIQAWRIDRLTKKIDELYMWRASCDMAKHD
jgi:hypothetical protein